MSSRMVLNCFRDNFDLFHKVHFILPARWFFDARIWFLALWKVAFAMQKTIRLRSHSKLPSLQPQLGIVQTLVPLVFSGFYYGAAAIFKFVKHLAYPEQEILTSMRAVGYPTLTRVTTKPWDTCFRFHCSISFCSGQIRCIDQLESQTCCTSLSAWFVCLSPSFLRPPSRCVLFHNRNLIRMKESASSSYFFFQSVIAFFSPAFHYWRHICS